jgi:glycine betaine/proline transport system permease protein
MVTLASILIAVPIGVAAGCCSAWRAVPLAVVRARAHSPVLDLMQTMPVFAYLVPILFLFGFGPVAAIVATVIYAMPPMTRITMLALRGVAPRSSISAA